MQDKKRVTLLWQPNDQSNNEYKNLFEELIDILETYGVILDDPGLVIRQLATNGVVLGTGEDVLRASNPAQIATDKATIADRMKAAILLDEANEQKYNHIKDDLDNDFSKGTGNYPTTMERSVNPLNTHKIKFDYTKKGVNLMSDEEEVAFIERGGDWKVEPDEQKKAMVCFLCNNKSYTK